MGQTDPMLFEKLENWQIFQSFVNHHHSKHDCYSDGLVKLLLVNRFLNREKCHLLNPSGYLYAPSVFLARPPESIALFLSGRVPISEANYLTWRAVQWALLKPQ